MQLSKFCAVLSSGSGQTAHSTAYFIHPVCTGIVSVPRGTTVAVAAAAVVAARRPKVTAKVIRCSYRWCSIYGRLALVRRIVRSASDQRTFVSGTPQVTIGSHCTCAAQKVPLRAISIMSSSVCDRNSQLSGCSRLGLCCRTCL